MYEGVFSPFDKFNDAEILWFAKFRLRNRAAKPGLKDVVGLVFLAHSTWNAQYNFLASIIKWK